MNASITLFGQPVFALEVAAAATGTAGVVLTIRRNILCFPVGILNVVLYCRIFLLPDVRLYADALLQVAFFVLLVYGWSAWKGTKAPETSGPERMSPREWRTFVPAVLLFSAIAGTLLHRLTDAALPWLDASLTSVSLGAQWMVARKKIENWWLWMAVNAVYVPMYFYKSLYLTALLYTVYLVLAVSGLRTWNQTASRS